MRHYKFPNPETKLCFSIGHPVIQQKTLFMHNAGFEHLGLNYLYLTQDIDTDNLKKGLSSLRQLNIAGISVTAPHKVTVLKYLDRLDETAEKIGACNTILPKDNVLTGFNSDYIGAIECLKKKIDIKGKTALVLGAGGVSRAIVCGLVAEEANVVVANRNVARAKILANEFGVEYGDINDPEVYKKYDLIINATSVGSKKSEDCTCNLCNYLGLNARIGSKASEIFLENKIALDVVFQRNTTEYTKAAEKMGHNVVYGHEMLVAQGAFQFKLFTGQDAPRDVMYSELKNNLEDW